MSSPRHVWLILIFCLALPLCAAQEDATKILDDMIEKIWSGSSDVEKTIATLQSSRDRSLAEIGTIGRMWTLHLNNKGETSPGIVASPSPSSATQPMSQSWPKENSIAGKPLPIRVQILLLRGVTGVDQTSLDSLEQLGSAESGENKIRIMEAIGRYHYFKKSYAVAKIWVQNGLKQYAFENAKYPISATFKIHLENLQKLIDLPVKKNDNDPLWEAGREASLTIDRGYFDLAHAALGRADLIIKEGGNTVEPILKQWIAYLHAKELAFKENTTEFLNYSAQVQPGVFGSWVAEVYLWRADDLFELGRISEASLVYNQSANWLDQHLGRPLPFDPIPQRLKAVATPPEDWYRKTRGGGRAISLPQAGALWNADTSKWYVPIFAVEAIVKDALCDLLLGNRKAALEKIERMKTLDAEDLGNTQRNMPSNYRRFADGFAQGGLFLSDEEKTRVPKSSIYDMWLIEVSHELERWDDAQVLVDRYLRRHKAEGADSLAPALLIKANIVEMNGNVRGADEILRDLLKKYPKSISAARAGIRLSQITPHMEEEVVPLLLQVAATFPNTKWSEEANSYRADALFFNGHREEGMKLIDSLIKSTSSNEKRDFYLVQKQSFTESLNKGSAK